MTRARMTKASAANLAVADKVGFDVVGNAQDFADYAENNYEETCTYLTSQAVMVWVERNGNRAYLCDASGPMVYETIEKAWRNIRRVRPDLTPTTI